MLFSLSLPVSVSLSLFFYLKHRLYANEPGSREGPRLLISRIEHIRTHIHLAIHTRIERRHRDTTRFVCRREFTQLYQRAR